MVCPWWLGYLLASPLRRLLQDPHTLLAPFVAEGMTVLEPGPGMGFFTLELARRVGRTGRVAAVDVQPRMLDGLRRRIRKAGLSDVVDVRQAPAEGMGVGDLDGKVDFVLAFAVVHELPDPDRFFTEALAALKTGCRLLLVEPRGHVNARAFRGTLETAERAGFRVEGGPPVARSRSAILVK